MPGALVVARDPELSDVVAAGEATRSGRRGTTRCTSTSAGLEPGTAYYYGFETAGERVAGRRGRRRCPATTPSACASRCARARSSTPGSSTPTRASPSATTSTSCSTSATTSTRRRTRRRRARRRAPTSAGRSSRVDECRTLADYRTRYAQYRRDPDVQRLHARAADDRDARRPRARRRRLGGRRRRARAGRARAVGASGATRRFQARWEWLPARPPDPADPTRVFRDVARRRPRRACSCSTSAAAATSPRSSPR